MYVKINCVWHNSDISQAKHVAQAVVRRITVIEVQEMANLLLVNSVK